MVDNDNFKQIGTLFGVPVLVDLTGTTPEKQALIISTKLMVDTRKYNYRPADEISEDQSGGQTQG